MDADVGCPGIVPDEVETCREGNADDDEGVIGGERSVEEALSRRSRPVGFWNTSL